MISTLIRGSSNSIPNTTRYREEYLVDTETNEIIYPKVLPSSIVTPPSNTEGVNPPITGGVSLSDYIENTVILNSKTIANGVNELVKFAIKDAGIYHVNALMRITDSAHTSTGITEHIFYITKGTFSDEDLIGNSSCCRTGSRSIDAGCSAVARLEVDDLVIIAYYNRLSTIKINKGFLKYTIIKLA